MTLKLLDPSNLKPERLHFTIYESMSLGVPVNGRYSIDYINRAKLILEESKKNQILEKNHSLTDALSNCKRAINYQVDTILHCLGLLENIRKSKKPRYTFPKKIELLNLIGVAAPPILNKINALRNKIEHEWIIPEQNNVEDAIDVAELFFYATNKFTKLFITGMGVEGEDIDNFDLYYESNRFIITYNLKSVESNIKNDLWLKWFTSKGPEKERLRDMLNKEREKTRASFEVKYEEDDELFIKWLKFLIQVQS